MGARHRHVLARAAGRLRDHVLRAPALGGRVDVEPHLVPVRHARAGAHDQGRDAGPDPAERGGRNLPALVVHHEQRAGAGPLGVLRLDAEEAPAALGQGDLAVSETVEVGALTAVADAARATRDAPGARVDDHAEVVAPAQPAPVDRKPGRTLAVEGKADLLRAHVPAGTAQPLAHVLDRGAVPRRAGGAVAAVLVGDPLERAQVIGERRGRGRRRLCRTRRRILRAPLRRSVVARVAAARGRHQQRCESGRERA